MAPHLSDSSQARERVWRKDGRLPKTLTLVIHGTFAAQSIWWRLGREGEATFADRLESELSRRGLTDTVWKPALEAGFDYSAFSWSGLNRHRDRVRGARRLSSSVNEFAKRVQTTADDPLIVNFVAHSHGGNVVLEALRHLGANVRVGRVSLLGTPLVTVRPAFRIAQFVFLTIILAFLFVLIIVVIGALATFLFTGHWFKPETELDASLLLWFPLVVIAYAWVFWVLGNFLDVAWRILCRVGLPIASMRKKARALVYGPSPRKLATILTGRPILLITSYNDEAGLLLQVGSAPARLYCEYLSTKFSIPMRVLEFAFIRPFTLVFLKATEMFLEVLSLGFSVRRALVQDFDIATRTRPVYYPADLLVQEQLDLRPQAVARSAGVADATGHSEKPEGDLRFNISLESSLQEVTAELKRQIRLRHSMYYEDDTIIVKLADFLIGVEPRGTAATTATLSGKRPPPEFWEGLLVANLGLALLCWWILGPNAEYRVLQALASIGFGYVVPFAILGLVFGASLAVRHRAPTSPWRWFWIFWAINALFFLLIYWLSSFSPA